MGLLTTSQLTSLASELNNDPEQLGYSVQLNSGNTGNAAAILNSLRDGSTPCPVNAVVGPSGNVTGATNATPIIVTSANHGRVNSDSVIIAGVLGNTAANGTWGIGGVTTNTFALTGSVGNGAYTSGGAWNWCVSGIKNATISASSLLLAMATADMVANPSTGTLSVLIGWMTALLSNTNSMISMLNADGSENNVAKNLKALVGGGGTASGTAIKALETRLGSRSEQLFGTGIVLSGVDIVAAQLGHY